MKNYSLPLLLLLVLCPVLGASSAAAGTRGTLRGEETYVLPDWFKHSFLEIQEDAKEAGARNKHVLLFMHIDRCPYCTRMLKENFVRGENRDILRKQFDVIALNIRGDREVIWSNHRRYTEKTLAQNFKVQFTPTMVFLNARGEKVFQMHGYRKPAAFRQVLDYVKDKHYLTMSLVDYINRQSESRYTLRPNPLFAAMTDFSKYKGPLAVIFEDTGCAGCEEFHKKVLMNKAVLAELKHFRLVRLDARSDKPIIDNTGHKTTPRNWARALLLDYRPGTVLFNEGREITRADGHLYHFHYKELLRYVAQGHYKTYPTYIKYLGVRQKQLLDAGVNIDVGL